MALSDTNSRLNSNRYKNSVLNGFFDDAEETVTEQKENKTIESIEKIEKTVEPEEEVKEGTSTVSEPVITETPKKEKLVQSVKPVTHDNFKVNKKAGESRYTVQHTSVFNQVKTVPSTISIREDLKTILDDISSDGKGTNKRGVKATIIKNGLLREFLAMGIITQEDFDSEYEPIKL